MAENPFPPRQERPASSFPLSTAGLLALCCPSPHPLVARVHRCQWDKEATRTPRGTETEFLQEAPLRTASNNSFQLEETLEICQNRFQHPSLPLICFSRGMETAAASYWHTPCWYAHWARHLRKLLMKRDSIWAPRRSLVWGGKDHPATGLGINLWKHFCLGEIN